MALVWHPSQKNLFHNYFIKIYICPNQMILLYHLEYSIIHLIKTISL